MGVVWKVRRDDVVNLDCRRISLTLGVWKVSGGGCGRVVNTNATSDISPSLASSVYCTGGYIADSGKRFSSFHCDFPSILVGEIRGRIRG